MASRCGVPGPPPVGPTLRRASPPRRALRLAPSLGPRAREGVMLFRDQSSPLCYHKNRFLVWRFQRLPHVDSPVSAWQCSPYVVRSRGRLKQLEDLSSESLMICSANFRPSIQPQICRSRIRDLKIEMCSHPTLKNRNLCCSHTSSFIPPPIDTNYRGCAESTVRVPGLGSETHASIA